MNWLYRALSPVYYSATRLRNRLYDKALLETVRLSIPVVSIGNISFGGSGKTPFVRWLCLQDFLRDKRVAILARAYRADFRAVLHKLDQASSRQPEIYGDEACMLAASLPDVDVYVCKDKSAAAARLAVENYDVLLVDDAFQHRRLQRDLDLLLLDSSVGLEKYQAFPAGELREEISELRRADFFIFTKAREAIPSLYPALRNYMGAKDYAVMAYQLGAPCRFTPQQRIEFLEPGELPYILVAGIAQPQQVETSFTEKFGTALWTKFYPDHHRFGDEDIQEMQAALNDCGAKYILCTEKDYTKIRNGMKNSSSLYFVPQDYYFLAGEEKLREVFARIFTSISQ